MLHRSDLQRISKKLPAPILTGILAGIAPFASAPTAQAAPAPPKVVRAVPDHADVAVDPALQELRFEFDQDMSPAGHSICGGFSPTGKPLWPNPRTLVIPVKLAPGTTYSISVNCPSAQNTRSAGGVAATVYPITFRTARAEDAQASFAPAQAAEWTKKLRQCIDKHYAYRGRLVKDWDAQFAAHDHALKATSSPGAFVRAAAQLLEPARDPHLYLRVDDITVAPPLDDPPPPNFFISSVRERMINPSQHGRNVLTGLLDDHTPYVLVGSWGSGEEAAINAAAEFVLQHREAPGLIIDVRPNGGGDELLARGFAGMFLAERRVYSRNRNIDPSASGGLTALLDRVIEPAEPHRRYSGEVALLIGPRCMSSNESFIFMMKQSPRVRTFGATTRGSSGNPKPHTLGTFGEHTVTIVLPSWQDFGPDGSPLEGVGIPPDAPVPYQGSGPDLVVDAALQWLNAPAELERNTVPPAPAP